MKKNEIKREKAGELCPECGLCCNGVLFGDIRVGRGEDPERLRVLGLAVEKRGKGHRCLQPCPAHDGKLCRVYQNRPASCRAFECRLLRRVNAGEVSVQVARLRISRAQAAVEWVAVLLRAAGEQDDSGSLSERFRRVMIEPMELGGAPSVIRARGRLMRAMERLANLLAGEFRI